MGANGLFGGGCRWIRSALQQLATDQDKAPRAGMPRRARVYTRLLAEGTVVVVGAEGCVRAESKTHGEGDGGRKCLTMRWSNGGV